MAKFTAKVIVKLKSSVKDIKGLTIEQSVKNLINIDDLSCRVGNVYYFDFTANNQIEALHIVEKITREILSNDVIETYEIRSLEEINE